MEWANRVEFAMTGAELELQEALVAMQRLLDQTHISKDTREALHGVIMLLRDEVA